MTFEQTITLFKARKVGAQRWVAVCPHHRSKNRSLSITKGDKTALIRCWSMNCPIEDICKAVGIFPSELWYEAIERDPRKREEAARKASEQQAADDWYEAERRKMMRDCTTKAVMWQRVAWHLGDMLGKRPEDARLGKLFHASLERSRHYHGVITGHEKGNRMRFDACAPGSIKHLLVKDVGVAIWQYLFLEEV